MLLCSDDVLACLQTFVGFNAYICMDTSLQSILQTHIQCSQVCLDLKKRFHKLRVEARLDDTCHFSGLLVQCENEVQRNYSGNPRHGFWNIILADEKGVVRITLFGEIANEQCPILLEFMERVPRRFYPKLKITHLVVRKPPEYPVQSVRILHCTKRTRIVKEGEHQLVMNPTQQSLVTDFNRLKVPMPFITHLKGVVIGDIRDRLTSDDIYQISFTLMDEQNRTLTCIAHDVAFTKDFFTEGKELILFYAVGQQGSRKTPGHLRILETSYVFSTEATLEPGAPIEEICLTNGWISKKSFNKPYHN